MDSIIIAIKGKIQEDPLGQLIDKLTVCWKDLSLNFINQHLAEILGYIWSFGVKCGIDFKTQKLAKEKALEELEKKRDVERSYI